MNRLARLAVGMRRCVVSVVIILPVSTSLNAQQPWVLSTFGPGDSFNPSSSFGLGIDPRQNVAQRFEYTGPSGYSLGNIRLALARIPFAVQYDVALWSGTDINSATLLESWRVDAPSVLEQEFNIFTMLSTTGTTLANTSVFWIAVSSPTPFGGGWAENSQGINGQIAYILNPRPGWRTVDSPSLAFEVTANASVVPEPSSLLLLSGPLVLLGAVRLFRDRLPTDSARRC